jgi:hypothetical protein
VKVGEELFVVGVHEDDSFDLPYRISINNSTLNVHSFIHGS